jgi:hypothetical protein
MRTGNLGSAGLALVSIAGGCRGQEPEDGPAEAPGAAYEELATGADTSRAFATTEPVGGDGGRVRRSPPAR